MADKTCKILFKTTRAALEEPMNFGFDYETFLCNEVTAYL